MELDQVNQLYSRYLKVTGIRTYHQHLYTINQFFHFLKEGGFTDIRKLVERDILGYLRSRYYYINQFGRQNSVRTRNLEISTLKHFLRFLHKEGLHNQDLASNVVYIKRPLCELPKDILTKREILKIFSLPDISTLQGYRDRTALEILYATGIRRKELSNLRIQDVDFKQECIIVANGKNGKDRVVPVNETTLRFIKNYLLEIRPKLENPENKHSCLLVKLNGDPVRENYANDMLKGYILKTKFKKNIHPHSFRHTLATHLIQSGMPLRHVQEILGHEHLDTTTQYLQLHIKDLQREYRKYHPKEKES